MLAHQKPWEESTLLEQLRVIEVLPGVLQQPLVTFIDTWMVAMYELSPDTLKESAAAADEPPADWGGGGAGGGARGKGSSGASPSGTASRLSTPAASVAAAGPGWRLPQQLVSQTAGAAVHGARTQVSMAAPRRRVERASFARAAGSRLLY